MDHTLYRDFRRQIVRLSDNMSKVYWEKGLVKLILVGRIRICWLNLLNFNWDNRYSDIIRNFWFVPFSIRHFPQCSAKIYCAKGDFTGDKNLA